MAGDDHDPYRILGVSPGATDAELRAAYRRLVQLHHPDHNGGSPESARRFEEVQTAYARIRELRQSAPRSGQAPPRPADDPGVESRIADLERELREAQQARDRARREAQEALERARRAAQEAATATAERGTRDPDRPSDEELGYVRTDDSFASILGDARTELAQRLAGAGDQAREHPVAKRVGEMIDELDELASKLRGRPPR
jgi:curved DNA-binding protein CbpA